MDITKGNWGLKGFAPSVLPPTAIRNDLLFRVCIYLLFVWLFFCFIFLFFLLTRCRHRSFCFTRDTFGSHILIQCCPEGLKFIKIDESTLLIHSPEHPGKQFMQAIIISASHCCSQNLKVSCRTNCHNAVARDIGVYVAVTELCCGSYSLSVHIFLLHSHPLYSQRSKSSLVLQENNYIASWKMSSCPSQYLYKKSPSTWVAQRGERRDRWRIL